MIALILKGGEPFRVFTTVEQRTAFLAEIPLRDGETLAEDAAHDTVPSGMTHAWNGTTFALIPPPEPFVPAPTTELTVREFKARFTDAEKDRIELAQEAHPDPMVRARLRRLEKELSSVKGQMCNRADRDLQRGVAFLTTVQLDGSPLLVSMTRAVTIIGADAFYPANLA
jgi:hypothetical protein